MHLMSFLSVTRLCSCSLLLFLFLYATFENAQAVPFSSQEHDPHQGVEIMSTGNPKSVPRSPPAGRDPYEVALEYLHRFEPSPTNTTSAKSYTISKNLPAIPTDPRISALLSKYCAQIRNLTLEAFYSSHPFPAHLTFVYGALALHLIFFQQDFFALEVFLHMLDILVTTFAPLEWTGIIDGGILILGMLLDYGWPIIQG